MTIDLSKAEIAVLRDALESQIADIKSWCEEKREWGEDTAAQEADIAERQRLMEMLEARETAQMERVA